MTSYYKIKYEELICIQTTVDAEVYLEMVRVLFGIKI